MNVWCEALSKPTTVSYFLEIPESWNPVFMRWLAYKMYLRDDTNDKVLNQMRVFINRKFSKETYPHLFTQLFHKDTWLHGIYCSSTDDDTHLYFPFASVTRLLTALSSTLMVMLTPLKAGFIAPDMKTPGFPSNSATTPGHSSENYAPYNLPILIYQGVHCCTKVCNLQLDSNPSKSRDNRMHWTGCKTCLNERVFIKTMNHLLTNCSQSTLRAMVCRLSLLVLKTS